MSEVAILMCSRTEDKHPFVHHCLTLPSPLLKNTMSKYITDTAFTSNGSQIAVITDQGHWTVYHLSVKKGMAEVVAAGSIELPVLAPGEHRTTWWKMEWNNNSDGLVIAENNALHYLNTTVSLASISN